jgi:glucose/arabinose dehydrogenase
MASVKNTLFERTKSMNKQTVKLLSMVIFLGLSLPVSSGDQLGQAIFPFAATGKLRIERIFEKVSFNRPVAMLQAPGNDQDFYVVEQGGRVLRVLSALGGAYAVSVFVDIQDRVDAGPNEAGLLGMAFAPDFQQTGDVYLSYTRSGSRFGSPLVSVISRFKSKDKGYTLDRYSEQVILSVDQPYSNHNGGNIAFGPDGYLYIGFGDGGAEGDPDGNGQNKETLLGALLRIDVNGKDAKRKLSYKIPPDNPFVGKPGRDEIYAYGFRNPWRWSFDRVNGELWLGDVGQNNWEEIDRVEKGANYGWPLREGAHCYSGDCDQAGLTDPVAEYSHNNGCSVTGGYVYRGAYLMGLQGVYLFGDYCSGKIWGLWEKDIDVYMLRNINDNLLLQTRLNIASFAEGNQGELYVIDIKGQIYRLITQL